MGIHQITDEELTRVYWEAQAQFGPFEKGPEDFIRIYRGKTIPQPSELETLRSRIQTGIDALAEAVEVIPHASRLAASGSLAVRCDDWRRLKEAAQSALKALRGEA